MDSTRAIDRIFSSMSSSAAKLRTFSTSFAAIASNTGNGEIDEAARNCAVRHALQSGAGQIGRLRHGDAAMLLYGFYAEDATAAAARKNDPDRVFAAILREGAEEDDRSASPMMDGAGFAKPQTPVGYRQNGVRRQDIDPVLFDRLAVAGDFDGHVGVARENFGEHALPIRRKMHDDDEGHARIGRHGGKLSEQDQPSQ